jgi:undecaprenyl-diphosphatase
VARWLSHGGRWPVLATATVALLAPSRASRRRWWLWCGVLVIAPLLGEAWQEVVSGPRPVGVALGVPSGHVTAVGTFSVVAISLAGLARLGRRWRRAVRVTVILAALAIGLARIVLGAHWPGDVAVGLALGAASATAAAWWDAARPPGRPRVPPSLAAVVPTPGAR